MKETVPTYSKGRFSCLLHIPAAQIGDARHMQLFAAPAATYAKVQCHRMMQPLVPVMTPAPGERLLRFVGDHVRFAVKDRTGRAPAKGWSAFLRTTLGRADALRREILQAHTRGLPLAGASCGALPIREDALVS